MLQLVATQRAVGPHGTLGNQALGPLKRAMAGKASHRAVGAVTRAIEVERTT